MTAASSLLNSSGRMAYVIRIVPSRLTVTWSSAIWRSAGLRRFSRSMMPALLTRTFSSG
jgi:hypothetical protein